MLEYRRRQRHGGTPKKYTKAELLAMLDKACPNALASFPDPEEFEFRTNDRHGKGNVALMVGHRVTQTKKRFRDDLWLEEHDTTTQQTAVRHPENKSNPLHFKEIWGSMGKKEWNLQRLYNGLYYTGSEDDVVNLKLKNAKGYKGTGVFSQFNAHGCVITPFNNRIKAIFRFILLHCDHATHYEEFKASNGNLQGINTLVRALRKVTSGAAVAEDEDKDEEEVRSQEGSAENQPVVSKGNHGSKKRALEDDEDDESAEVASKKARGE